jgi:hypothetical protein
MYTSISDTRISLALNLVRKSAGTDAHSAPPMAPATTIIRQQERARAAREVERDASAGDRADDELAFGSDVPDVGAKADGEADGDQHQRRRLEQELRPSVRILQRT